MWTGPVGWWRPGLESATQSGQPGCGASNHCSPKGFACSVSGWGDLVLTQRLGAAVLGSERECCRKCREEEAGIWPSKENSRVLGKQRIFPKVACCLSQFCGLFHNASKKNWFKKSSWSLSTFWNHLLIYYVITLTIFLKRSFLFGIFFLTLRYLHFPTAGEKRLGMQELAGSSAGNKENVQKRLQSKKSCFCFCFFLIRICNEGKAGCCLLLSCRT